MHKKNKASIYKSGLEDSVAEYLTNLAVSFLYEPDKIPFIQPQQNRNYIPDWKIGEMYLETKGKLTAEDRKKYEWFKQSNPNIDVRFVFMRATEKIRRGSKTTYGDWATNKGFMWCDFRQGIPTEWLKEYQPDGC